MAQAAGAPDIMWSEFLAARPGLAGPKTKYSVWHFGSDQALADELAGLVVSGCKRATASLFWCYEAEDEELPRVGDFSVITDWRGQAVCIIRTTVVEIIAFDQVSEEHATAEGEGDGSLAYWREAHTAAFAMDLAELGRAAEPDMPVVCERFEVVYGA